MRTALYLRVSTMQQKPDLQRDGLRSYARRTGLEIVTCSGLITSKCRLDYSANFGWDYVRIDARSGCHYLRID